MRGADTCTEGLFTMRRPSTSVSTASCSAVADAIAASEGYTLSQRKRKLIGQRFGWARSVGPIRQVLMLGIKKGVQLFVMTMAVRNLVRMRTSAQLRPVTA